MGRVIEVTAHQAPRVCTITLYTGFAVELDIACQYTVYCMSIVIADHVQGVFVMIHILYMCSL